MTTQNDESSQILPCLLLWRTPRQRCRDGRAGCGSKRNPSSLTFPEGKGNERIDLRIPLSKMEKIFLTRDNNYGSDTDLLNLTFRDEQEKRFTLRFAPITHCSKKKNRPPEGMVRLPHTGDSGASFGLEGIGKREKNLPRAERSSSLKQRALKEGLYVPVREEV